MTVLNLIKERVIKMNKKETKKMTQIVQKKANQHLIVNDFVASEEEMRLWVDGVQTQTFYCTPIDLDVLALGYLKNCGLINHRHDVHSLEIKGMDVYISLTNKHREDKKNNTAMDTKVKDVELLTYFQEMEAYMDLFHETGGVHSGALFSGGNLICFVTDVARHNVLDRLAGHMLMANKNTQGMILAFTGRQALAIVSKAVSMGVSVLAGISAPTSAGVELAQTANLTLIGFVRGERFNIYTYPERISYSEGEKAAEKIPVITITGPKSGSGKTHVIKELLEELSQRGVRCAVFKRSGHMIDCHDEGKDSRLFRNAGAVSVYLDAPEEKLILLDKSCGSLWDKVYQSSDADLIIMESRTGREGDVYHVLRKNIVTKEDVQDIPQTDYVISDFPEAFPQNKTFNINNIKIIADDIMKKYYL